MLSLFFKVIAAEGEQKASRALREAAEVIAESPSALQVKINTNDFRLSEQCKKYKNSTTTKSNR